MREVPIPTDVKLERRLELFRDINADYERTKEKCTYLGSWLLELSGEIMMLRTDLREEGELPDGQLKMFEVPYAD